MPVSARRTTTASKLGNRVGARLVEVPAVGPMTTRIEALAQGRRDEPPASADESAAVLGPILRLLVWLRLFHRFVDHQRMIHTVVTNLRGPEERFTFVGAELREVVPLTSVTGNVTVAFAVLSYAGTIVITLVADPDAFPEVDDARELLEAQLAALVMAPAERGSR